MRLGEFILRDMQSILERWESFATTRLPAAERMSARSLRDHGPEILQAIAADLATPQTEEEQTAKSMGLAPSVPGAPRTAAQIHAVLRAESGFDIDQLASEYRALRASVLKGWMEACLPEPPNIEDLLRFNEAIDQALAESVASFTVHVTRARNLLLGMLSHDLRSPLHAIQMTARHMQATATDDDLGRATERIVRSGARMQTLLDDLVDFNRSELRLGIRVAPRDVDLAEVCAEEVEQIQATYPKRAVELQVTGNCKGSWDPDRVQQVLDNLVLNALHYGDPDGPIRVEVHGAETGIRLSVTNGGETIDDETIAHLFEPLRRGHGDTHNNESGLGLGLYIASEIAKAHGGTIAATSAGRETVFTVTLPRRSTAPAGR